MDLRNQSRGLVFFAALLISGVLFLTKPGPAAAQTSPQAGLGVLLIGVVATYVVVMTVVCTPVAAFSASDHQKGFSGAFADCFMFRSFLPNAAAADQPRAEAARVEARDERDDERHTE